MRFTLKTGEPFAFAGLYEDAVSGSPESRSCSIVTCAPNALVAPIHDRMPVILAETAFDLWLDRELDDVDVLRSVLRPYPAEEMQVRPVSPRLNNARNDGSEMIAEYHPPEALSLL